MGATKFDDPITNDPELLMDYQDVQALDPNTYQRFGPFDTNRFSTILYDAVHGFGPAFSMLPPEFFKLTTSWDAGDAQLPSFDSIATYPQSQTGQFSVSLPVRGRQAYLDFNNMTTKKLTGIPPKIRVYGLAQPTNGPIVRQPVMTGYTFDDADPSVGQVSMFVASIAASPASAIPLPIIPGRAVVTIAPSSAPTALGRYVLQNHQGRWMTAARTMPVAAQFDAIIEFETIMPAAPVYLECLTKPTGPASLSISITWDPHNV